MSTSIDDPTTVVNGAGRAAYDENGLTRLSARFGVAFTLCQLSVMVLMAVFVLPHGGSPNDPALERDTTCLTPKTSTARATTCS